MTVFSLRGYLSVSMLRSSHRAATRATEIESEHDDWSSPHADECLDAVVSAVVNAGTFMEAVANELFTDAFEGHGLTGNGYLAEVDASLVALMRAWWEESNGGFENTLSKYQLLLAFGRQERLDQSAEPYQSAKLLIQLRNALVHFRPISVDDNSRHSLEARLAGKFPANRLLPTGAVSSWPNSVLSAGCAEWAIASAEAFVDEVVGRLCIEPSYLRLRRGGHL